MPREWLQYAFGTDVSPVVQYAVAFVLIFAALGAGAMVLRRLHANRTLPESHTGQMGRQPRLGIVDIYEMDAQRRLILLRRDGVEHLLLVGGPNDLVIEQRIERAPAVRAELVAALQDEAVEPAAPPPRQREARKDPDVPSYASDTPKAVEPVEPVVDLRKPEAERPATPTATSPTEGKAAGRTDRLDPEILSNVARELETALSKGPAKEPPAQPVLVPAAKVKDTPAPELRMPRPLGVATPTASLEKPIVVSAEPAGTDAVTPAQQVPPVRPSESKDAAKVIADPFSMDQIEQEFARLLGQSRSNRG